MGIIAPVLWALLGQAPAVPLAGTVVDPEGRPVVGAELWLAGVPWYTGPELLARGEADARGRFTLRRPADAEGRGADLPLMLWAYRPGHRLGRLAFPAQLPDPERPVRLELGPPARTVVRVVGPDQEPVAGAQVRLTVLSGRPFRMPVALIDRLATTADDEGRAVIDGVPPEQVLELRVRAAAFGWQTRTFNPPAPDDKTVWLRPVGSLAGRLVADDPEAVRGWTIQAATAPDDEPGYRGNVSWARVTSDEHGRFEVPQLASGRLTLTAQPPAGLVYRARERYGETIRAGQRTEVEVPVLRGVPVEGVVRERETGAPVPGVGVSLNHLAPSSSRPESAQTDEHGRYTLRALPGKVRFSLSDVPETHVWPQGITWKDFDVPEDAGPITLEPIELARGTTVSGVVLDEAGQPVARVEVTGDWQSVQGTGRARATSDAQGAFRLGRIPPGAEVTLTARRPDAVAVPPATTRAGDGSPVTLRLKPRATLSLRGRVLGPDGRPLADALVRLEYRRRQGQSITSMGRIAFEALDEVRTGADGTFQTPPELPPDDEYRAEVTARGMAAAQTDWIGPPATTFPDLHLRRVRTLRTIAGRVRDGRGQPVAGATVFQTGDGPRRTETTADAQGRFRLRGVFAGRAFLFVQRDGFRFQGHLLAPDAEEAEIVLSRTDEPPSRTWRTRPPPVPRREELALVRDLLDAAPPPVQTRSGEPTDRFLASRRFQAQARLDPEGMLRRLEDRTVGAHQETLRVVALGLLEDDPAEAIAVIEADRNPATQAGGLLALFDATPAADRPRRRDLLERATRQLGRLPDAEETLPLLARVAELWLDLGERQRAAEVLRRGRTIAAGVKEDTTLFRLGEFAAVLARIDPPAALELVRKHGRADPQLSRYLAGIAPHAAAIDPAEAQRLLESVPENHADLDGAILRACRRMAPVDLPRARRLAARLARPQHTGARPTLEAYALGLMAHELADSNPDAARDVLEEAFAALRRIAEENAGRWVSPPVACVMAELLPVVERIDPDRLDESSWLAIAYRPARPERLERQQVMPLAVLALLLARSNREAAAAVFEPVAEALPALVNELGREMPTVCQAAAIIDPHAALALIQRLPDEVQGPPPRRIKDEARLTVAGTLILPVHQRPREALRFPYHPWPLDRAD